MNAPHTCFVTLRISGLFFVALPPAFAKADADLAETLFAHIGPRAEPGCPIDDGIAVFLLADIALPDHREGFPLRRAAADLNVWHMFLSGCRGYWPRTATKLPHFLNK